MKLCDQEVIILAKYYMSHPLHVFPLISLHELTPITDAYQWMHITIWNRLYFMMLYIKLIIQLDKTDQYKPILIVKDVTEQT